MRTNNIFHYVFGINGQTPIAFIAGYTQCFNETETFLTLNELMEYLEAVIKHDDTLTATEISYLLLELYHHTNDIYDGYLHSYFHPHRTSRLEENYLHFDTSTPEDDEAVKPFQGIYKAYTLAIFLLAIKHQKRIEVTSKSIKLVSYDCPVELFFDFCGDGLHLHEREVISSRDFSLNKYLPLDTPTLRRNARDYTRRALKKFYDSHATV